MRLRPSPFLTVITFRRFVRCLSTSTTDLFSAARLTCPSAAGLMSHSQYLSGRSAEVILSDVRPTKARPETLQAVNKLLDELLLLIISSARSIATEKLKAGLLKVLPTPLGKDAILEAEIELRAYQERTAPADPAGAADNGSPKDFPLVPVFEVRARA